MTNKLKILILEHSNSDFKLISKELQKTSFNLKLNRVKDESSFQKSLDSFSPEIILSNYNTPGYFFILGS